MTDVYEKIPVFESENIMLRPIADSDAEDLLTVYADKNALPFFNSDNCNGDNFYYPTLERMSQAIQFWNDSYRERWFVRWAVVDRTAEKAIGTIELFHRDSNDDSFTDTGLLRLDLRSDWEKEQQIAQVLELIVPHACSLFHCSQVATKIPVYAVERIAAAQSLGFTDSGKPLLGTHDRKPYYDYWTVRREQLK